MSFKVSYNKDTLNLQKLGYSEPSENTGNNDNNVYIKTDLADFRSNSDAKGLVDYTWQNASDNNSVLTFDFKGKNIELENLPYEEDITATPSFDNTFVAEHNIIYGDINTAIANSLTTIGNDNKYKITFNGKLKLPQYSAGLFALHYSDTPTRMPYCKEIDLTNVDMNNIVNASYMFRSCISLTSFDLTKFTGENVTNTMEMFRNCNMLTSLNLSNFTGENLAHATNMFSDCINLTTLDLRNFTGENITNASYMFMNCSSLTTLIMKGSAINTIINLGNSDLSLDTGVTVEDNKTYRCTCTYDSGVKIIAVEEIIA